jgi:hypothetical protein
MRPSVEIAQPIPRFAIALVSASALAYEILLMRLFSITQWHHFAYMIISLALLGYGASGTFLALAREPLLARFRGAFSASLFLFGLSALVCALAAQRLAFNPEELLWNPRQLTKLVVLYLLLALPFFFAATGIGLALSRCRSQIARIYRADLLGAGIGSMGIVLLLFILFPGRALQAISALGFGAAALGWWELAGSDGPVRGRPIGRLLALAPILPLLLPGDWTRPVLSPYKGLSQALQITGTRIIAERASPLGVLSVLESPQVPLRHAPGLSIMAATTPPDQIGVFTDGDAMTVITRDSGDPAKLAHLDQLTSALPYHLKTPQQVLILGAGGGSDVLQARRHAVHRIDAVELNPQIATLVRRDFAAFSGNLYDSPEVRLHIAEARGFVEGAAARYDLVQLSMLDAFAASAAGLYALSESYLYTVEALDAYLARLAPGGYLAMTRWIKLPPRDTLKLFATAVAVLERRAVASPGRRLALIRGWQTSTLLVKNGDFSAAEIDAIRAFCSARAFDVAWYPGMPADEANRRNVLQEPIFYRAAVALLGPERAAFLADYKFNLRPATDDRPYFFHFFKWRTLPEILRLRGQGGMPLLEAGYLVLAATLLQALLVSGILILAPIGLWRRRKPTGPADFSRPRVLVYFLAIGLAFLFMEIAFIQKFILFLSHPLYAAAAVLSAFLIFAGLGSGFSERLGRRTSERAAVACAVAAIAVLGVVYLLVLGPIFKPLMGQPGAARVAIAVALIAPLAFAMGMPFPLALGRLAKAAPDLIPWAWAVNGCASVLSAVLATLLAIHLGFNLVVMLAIGLYGIAWASFPRS